MDQYADNTAVWSKNADGSWQHSQRFKQAIPQAGGLPEHIHDEYATDADLAAHVAAANPHDGYATDADVAALAARLAVLENPPAVEVWCTNSQLQSIPNVAWTTITGWNSAKRDTHTSWSAGLPSRLTCKRSGLYLVLATLAFDANATGGRWAKVIRNGSTSFVMAPRVSQSVGTGGQAEPNYAQFVDLLSASYIELQAYQSCGGPLGINGTFSDVVSSFSMFWLRA